MLVPEVLKWAIDGCSKAGHACRPHSIECSALAAGALCRHARAILCTMTKHTTGLANTHMLSPPDEGLGEHVPSHSQCAGG